MLEDYTGSLPTHKMTGEIIPPSEFASGNLVLSKGSFFLDSLTLINVSTGEELIKNRDWKPRVLDSAATGHSGGKLIYSLIELTNTLTVNISATYQYVGGSKIQQREAIINLLDTLGDTELSKIYYSNLKNRPHSFDVTEEHLHDASQITGKDEEIAALANIHQSLERIGNNVSLGMESDIVAYIYEQLRRLNVREGNQEDRILSIEDLVSRYYDDFIETADRFVGINSSIVSICRRIMELETDNNLQKSTIEELESHKIDIDLTVASNILEIIKNQTDNLNLMLSQFKLDQRLLTLENNNE